MKIKRSIVLPFIIGGILLLLSEVAAYAVYFSNPEGWTHQPVPEGTTDRREIPTLTLALIPEGILLTAGSAGP